MGFRGRYRNKRDGNEKDIVDDLRARGFSVYRLDKPLDLLIGKHGKTWLAEVKMEGEQLSGPQAAFFEEWRGNRLIFRSVQDVAEFHHMAQRIEQWPDQ